MGKSGDEVLPCSVVSRFRFGETSCLRACTGLWVMFSSQGEGSKVCELGVRGGLGEVIVFWTGEVGLEGDVIVFWIGEIGLGGELGGLRG